MTRAGLVRTIAAGVAREVWSWLCCIPLGLLVIAVGIVEVFVNAWETYEREKDKR